MGLKLGTEGSYNSSSVPVQATFAEVCGRGWLGIASGFNYSSDWEIRACGVLRAAALAKLEKVSGT